MTIDIKNHPRAHRRGWPVAGLVMVSTLVTAWACGLGGQPADPCDPYRVSVAQSVAKNVMGPTFVAFETRGGELAAATAVWASAAESGSDTLAARDAARTAWSEALGVWQRAELMQVGPAGSSAYVVGGEDLRDEVYSWPTVSPCRVDEELLAGAFADPGFFEDALVNVKGLDAVEYLLFHDTADNACDATNPINADGTWAALAPDQLEQRRSAYAAAASAHIVANASRLATAWGPGGDFANWLANPGEDGSPYVDPSAAVDDLMNAALYLDVSVKDRKLAASSPAEVESAYGARSKEHALGNLEGLRQLLLGANSADAGYGFDDFLGALEQPQLAQDLLTAVDEAVTAVEGIDGTFAEALAADPAALDQAETAVQQVTDLLKGPFVTTLKLRPPGEGAGDAD